jgi:uncharacterized protein involved in exopolysaccharide biosynthesis
MLDRIKRINPPADAYVLDADGRNDLLDMIAFLFSNKGKIFLSFVVGVLLSAGYFWITPARYTATAQIIVDPDSNRFSRQDGRLEGPLDASMMESQVAVLRADRIAREVVNTLGLIHDKEFFSNEPSLKQRLFAYLGRETASANVDEQIQIATAQLQKSLDVKRVGISYVIDVAVSSQSKEKSSAIANAVAHSYLQAQSDVRSDSIRAADKWLEDRLSIIRTETLAAEAAVQEFKAQSKTASAGAVLVDLESYAKLKRNLYESFLQRHLEISQHENSPSVVARILSPAFPPLQRSEPRSMIVLGAGAVLGLLIGIALAFAFEAIRKFKDMRPDY